MADNETYPDYVQLDLAITDKQLDLFTTEIDSVDAERDRPSQ